ARRAARGAGARARRCPHPRALARRAEPDRLAARPHPWRAERALGGAAAGAASRRARRLLRLRRHRLRRPAPRVAPRPRGAALPRLLERVVTARPPARAWRKQRNPLAR